eukprot:6586072-Alexandrium_andersonii.AAC.1
MKDVGLDNATEAAAPASGASSSKRPAPSSSTAASRSAGGDDDDDDFGGLFQKAKRPKTKPADATSASGSGGAAAPNRSPKKDLSDELAEFGHEFQSLMQMFRDKPDELQPAVLDDLKNRVSKKLKPLTDAGRLSDLVTVREMAQQLGAVTKIMKRWNAVKNSGSSVKGGASAAAAAFEVDLNAGVGLGIQIPDVMTGWQHREKARTEAREGNF